MFSGENHPDTRDRVVIWACAKKARPRVLPPSSEDRVPSIDPQAIVHRLDAGERFGGHTDCMLLGRGFDEPVEINRAVVNVNVDEPGMAQV